MNWKNISPKDLKEVKATYDRRIKAVNEKCFEHGNDTDKSTFIRYSKARTKLRWHIVTMMKQNDMLPTKDKPKAPGSKRNRTMLRRLSSPVFSAKVAILKQALLPDVPEVLIGNAVICELPFSELSNYADHHRLQVFLLKGTACIHPECNRVGSRLIQTMDAGGGLHLDIFTHDLKHMNVDHIVAKSNGGADDISNKQPMCAYHNTLKSNHDVPY